MFFSEWSHTRTTVRECYKHDRSCLREMGKFDPATPYPWLMASKISNDNYVINFYRCTKFHKDIFRGFISTHARICAPSVYSAIFSCFGSWRGLAETAERTVRRQDAQARVFWRSQEQHSIFIAFLWKKLPFCRPFWRDWKFSIENFTVERLKSELP